MGRALPAVRSCGRQLPARLSAPFPVPEVAPGAGTAVSGRPRSPGLAVGSEAWAALTGRCCRCSPGLPFPEDHVEGLLREAARAGPHAGEGGAAAGAGPEPGGRG